MASQINNISKQKNMLKQGIWCNFSWGILQSIWLCSLSHWWFLFHVTVLKLDYKFRAPSAQLNYQGQQPKTLVYSVPTSQKLNMASLKAEKPSAAPAQPKQQPPRAGAAPRSSGPSATKAPHKKAEPKPAQHKRKVEFSTFMTYNISCMRWPLMLIH